ncbi:MAG: sn-glycerol-3-phosphate ABC transporter ATP-binding protein UgpC [Salinisphaera sp.]|jgi:multiple sugar transport system ATP-binding protein|nr:sn-glycerol-3-phosphate ABC transporter ATP-binding protein UgpC [Salinisphaera sp.]
MSQVKLKGIDKVFGNTQVLDGVEIDIADGEFMVFVGPSGCGKTTLMRTIAGLERPSAGHVLIDEADVTRAHPAHRGVAMVFQSYALYPHMTVFENIAFGLRLSKKSRSDVDAAVRDVASILQIEPLLERKPSALSGGQRQRVAIGRAIVRDPKVFLFDEPLSNLDAALRVQMRVELIKLHQRLKATMIYVTHDQTEAMTMADRIVVLNGGRVEQLGTPLELYGRPVNRFVAGFIGSPKMNFLEVSASRVDDGGVTVTLPGDVELTVPVDGEGVEVGSALTFGVRPEHVGIRDGVDGPADVRLSAQVDLVEHLGSEILVHAKLFDDYQIEIKSTGHDSVTHDDRLEVAIRTRLCHLFGDDGRALSPLADESTPVTA